MRLYDNGSGGAPVSLLQRILDLTRENETLVGGTVRSHTGLQAAEAVPAGR
jgi:monodechloroaminopyrrolnitrin synthase